MTSALESPQVLILLNSSLMMLLSPPGCSCPPALSFLQLFLYTCCLSREDASPLSGATIDFLFDPKFVFSGPIVGWAYLGSHPISWETQEQEQ